MIFYHGNPIGGVYRLDNFTENHINPITAKPYDNSWIIWQLTDSEEYKQMVGSFNGCAYTIKFSRYADGWEMSVCDFIEFNKRQNKNIILVISEEDLKSAQERYEGHSFNEPILRKNEQIYTVHSTSLENWELIQKDGYLKSWNRLKAENVISEEKPIGNILGDPNDFSDYIMFGKNIAGELVVNSKQQGKITMDGNAEYLTGARLYLDMKKIVEDGLAVRDGAHLKVKDKLPLNPYLIWAATWENIGLESRVSTPKNFSEKANGMFYKRYPQYE